MTTGIEPGELKILTSFQMETDLCAMFELELVSHAIIIFGEPCLFATRRHLSYPILLPPRKETECVLTSPLNGASYSKEILLKELSSKY